MLKLQLSPTQLRVLVMIALGESLPGFRYKVSENKLWGAGLLHTVSSRTGGPAPWNSTYWTTALTPAGWAVLEAL